MSASFTGVAVWRGPGPYVVTNVPLVASPNGLPLCTPLNVIKMKASNRADVARFVEIGELSTAEPGHTVPVPILT
jgi:hypothetical protein